jgi:ketosteroid isomerase-like protein
MTAENGESWTRRFVSSMTHRHGGHPAGRRGHTMLAQTLIVAATFFAVLVSPENSRAAANGDIDALVATDKRMQRAFVERDVATLDRIITDDYLLVASNGAERRKPAILAEVTSPDVIYEINESSEWAVRVHGDTAIVVALLHQKGVDHGQPFDYSVKFSDTYVRENGAWRNMHAHATRVPAAKASG